MSSGRVVVRSTCPCSSRSASSNDAVRSRSSSLDTSSSKQDGTDPAHLRDHRDLAELQGQDHGAMLPLRRRRRARPCSPRLSASSSRCGPDRGRPSRCVPLPMLHAARRGTPRRPAGPPARSGPAARARRVRCARTPGTPQESARSAASARASLSASPWRTISSSQPVEVPRVLAALLEHPLSARASPGRSSLRAPATPATRRAQSGPGDAVARRPRPRTAPARPGWKTTDRRPQGVCGERRRALPVDPRGAQAAAHPYALLALFAGLDDAPSDAGRLRAGRDELVEASSVRKLRDVAST